MSPSHNTGIQRPYAAAPAVHDDRLQLLRSMLADRHWHCPAPVHARLLHILSAHHADEADWITLAEETERYLAQRRHCLLQAIFLD